MDNHVVIFAVDFTVTVPEVIPSLNGSDADSVYLGGPGVYIGAPGVRLNSSFPNHFDFLSHRIDLG